MYHTYFKKIAEGEIPPFPWAHALRKEITKAQTCANTCLECSKLHSREGWRYYQNGVQYERRSLELQERADKEHEKLKAVWRHMARHPNGGAIYERYHRHCDELAARRELWYRLAANVFQKREYEYEMSARFYELARKKDKEASECLNNMEAEVAKWIAANM